jgi:hypothetical protein
VEECARQACGVDEGVGRGERGAEESQKGGAVRRTLGV